MNAVRAYARELTRPVVKENPRLLATYCDSISTMVDFLQGMLVLYPKWGQFRFLFDVLILPASGIGIAILTLSCKLD